MDQSESIVLQNFHTNISESLDKLFSGRKNGSNNEISLGWYIPCFKFLQSINRAFTKLVKDLNYPVSKWSGKLAEDYFSYTLNLLDALNMISSLISQVGISRLNLTHAISLITTSPSSSIQHLVPIIPKKGTVFESKEMSKDGRFNCGQERVIHEAMMEMRGVDMLVLRVLLCGLNGEKNEELGGLFTEDTRGSSPGFKQLYEPPQTWGVTEIKEVNEIVKRIEACLFSGENEKGCENAQELKRKLSEVERLTEMVGKEVNCLFSEVLARRNELINCFRLPQCS